MSKSSVMNTYGRFDVTFEKGKGVKLYDTNGKEYIDFVSGVAVNCLGHCHPSITKAVIEQSNNLIQVSNYYWNTKHTLLAEKLTENSDHNKVFFCNSGTEAIEGALKIAKKYGTIHGNGDKNTILYMNHSFHGRTIGALSVTGQPKYQKDFMPLMGGVESVEFNNIDDLKEKFSSNVCGVIVEPIQGESGINVADVDFLKELRNLCDQHNALLIFDEVQCGIGRTGSLFAYKKFGVIPDVIAVAKALGGGFPIGATIANERAASAFVPGDHGSTFGGNPLVCAVAVAVLDELIDGKVIDSIPEKEAYLRSKLTVLKEKYGLINEIKGMGLLIGISINGENYKALVNKCFEKGLLVVTAGSDVVRLLPPLNVTKEEIDEALALLELAMKEMVS